MLILGDRCLQLRPQNLYVKVCVRGEQRGELSAGCSRPLGWKMGEPQCCIANHLELHGRTLVIAEKQHLMDGLEKHFAGTRSRPLPCDQLGAFCLWEGFTPRVSLGSRTGPAEGGSVPWQDSRASLIPQRKQQSNAPGK